MHGLYKLLCVLVLLGAFISVTHAQNRIAINEHENVHRERAEEEQMKEYEEGDPEAPSCDITINGTYYPCWLTLTPAEVPRDGCYFCAPGYYSDTTTWHCVETCPSGWCAQGYNCSACPPGTYANEDSSYWCPPCPYGFISDTNASTACTPCAAGTEANTGRTQCNICSAGSFSADGTQCELCQRGTFSDIDGANQCIQCGNGFYNQAEGQRTCFMCPQGQYCPSSTTSTPEICPANSYCPIGTTQPYPCASLYRSSAGSASCSAGFAFYAVIVCSVLGFFGIIFVMWKFKNHLQGREQSERRLEIDRLIPPSHDGPVYRGL